MKTSVKTLLFASVLATAFGCSREAEVVSHNISQKADNFEIERRVIFYNGITDKYILVIRGRCNIDVDRSERQLAVTCKVASDEYKKHYLGLSDNVTYFVEQLRTVDVNSYHYAVTFMPQSVLPDVDFRGDADALRKAVTPDTKD